MKLDELIEKLENECFDLRCVEESFPMTDDKDCDFCGSISVNEESCYVNGDF